MLKQEVIQGDTHRDSAGRMMSPPRLFESKCADNMKQNCRESRILLGTKTNKKHWLCHSSHQGLEGAMRGVCVLINPCASNRTADGGGVQRSFRSFWIPHRVSALLLSCSTSSWFRVMLTTLATPLPFSTQGSERNTSSPIPCMFCRDT